VKAKNIKNEENDPFSYPLFFGNVSPVEWMVPTLSINPNVSNKTNSLWGSLVFKIFYINDKKSWRICHLEVKVGSPP
jgi:hypothetical protein